MTDTAAAFQSDTFQNDTYQLGIFNVTSPALGAAAAEVGTLASNKAALASVGAKGGNTNRFGLITERATGVFATRDGFFGDGLHPVYVAGTLGVNVNRVVAVSGLPKAVGLAQIGARQGTAWTALIVNRLTATIGAKPGASSPGTAKFLALMPAQGAKLTTSGIGNRRTSALAQAVAATTGKFNNPTARFTARPAATLADKFGATYYFGPLSTRVAAILASRASSSATPITGRFGSAPFSHRHSYAVSSQRTTNGAATLSGPMVSFAPPSPRVTGVAPGLLALSAALLRSAKMARYVTPTVVQVGSTAFEADAFQLDAFQQDQFVNKSVFGDATVTVTALGLRQTRDGASYVARLATNARAQGEEGATSVAFLPMVGEVVGVTRQTGVGPATITARNAVAPSQAKLGKAARTTIPLGMAVTPSPKLASRASASILGARGVFAGNGAAVRLSAMLLGARLGKVDAARLALKGPASLNAVEGITGAARGAERAVTAFASKQELDFSGSNLFITATLTTRMGSATTAKLARKAVVLVPVALATPSTPITTRHSQATLATIDTDVEGPNEREKGFGILGLRAAMAVSGFKISRANTNLATVNGNLSAVARVEHAAARAFGALANIYKSFTNWLADPALYLKNQNTRVRKLTGSKATRSLKLDHKRTRDLP